MTQVPSSPNSKRLDLQGIRGIAIISVIGFHFLPSIFPNGYIGVDQFFVLSGFLMCMLLRKSSSTSTFSLFQYVFNFYIRRLKRILPAYFLIILSAMIAIFTIFPLTSIDTNVKSGKKALVFMSNRPETTSENYFSMLSMAIDVFTHTWSLSVEVKFYVIAPFLYLIGAKYIFGGDFEIPYYFIVGAISYMYSLLFLSEHAAFNSVPGRVWQFSVGMIAYSISDSKIFSGNSREMYLVLEGEESSTEEEMAIKYFQEESSPSAYIHVFLLAFITFGSIFPTPFPSFILRPLLTVLTGALMIAPSKHTGHFLESRLLTYIGDVSYSLYLIHWPIYAYWKLELSQEKIWNWELAIAFGVAVILAIISYEFYEKWYLKQSNQLIFIICSALFLLNIVVFHEEYIQNFISPFPENPNRLDGLNESEIVSFDKAERLNKKWSKYDLKYLSVPSCKYEQDSRWGTCRTKGLNNKTTAGKFKIMLIGNSWAANHGTILYQECKNKAHSMVQYVLSACDPLQDSYRYCKGAVDKFENEVAKEKPDYLFIIARFVNDEDAMPANVTKLEDDPTFQTMKINAEKLSILVKHKIFIMQQIPKGNFKLFPLIVKNLKEHKNLVAFDKSLIMLDSKMTRLRYEKLASECSKCELFDYQPQFFNETTQTWRFYDERNHGLSYVTQGIHLSFHGLELIRPVIRGVCERIGL